MREKEKLKKMKKEEEEDRREKSTLFFYFSPSFFFLFLLYLFYFYSSFSSMLPAICKRERELFFFSSVGGSLPKPKVLLGLPRGRPWQHALAHTPGMVSAPFSYTLMAPFLSFFFQICLLYPSHQFIP